MRIQQVENMLDILESFLGKTLDRNRDYDIENPDTLQYRFNCPRCAEDNGGKPDGKFNLEVNLAQGGVFNCWRCSAGDDGMHGPIMKLISDYGSPKLASEYKEELRSLVNSNLYNPKYMISGGTEQAIIETQYLSLPDGFHYVRDNKYSAKALSYLKSRGIDMDIISRYKIGYTEHDDNNKLMSDRIILPSYNADGYLNYWTGRDTTGEKWKQKYMNPKIDRKSIIFNESLINWDADITLVEGPFDSIVCPNFVPLLGKKLNKDFVLYARLFERAHANVNIFLDGDALADVKTLYKQLNTGSLLGRIRYIPVDKTLDPSEIFQRYGRRGIIDHLAKSRQFTDKEVFLE